MNPDEPKLQLNLRDKEIYQYRVDAIRGHAQRLGCPLDLTGVDFTLTGVDIDPVAMKLRRMKSVAF
jgi:hypothetical protein